MDVDVDLDECMDGCVGEWICLFWELFRIWRKGKEIPRDPKHSGKVNSRGLGEKG